MSQAIRTGILTEIGELGYGSRLLPQRPDRVDRMVRSDTGKVDAFVIGAGDEDGDTPFTFLRTGGTRMGGIFDVNWLHTVGYVVDKTLLTEIQVSERLLAVATRLAAAQTLGGISRQVWSPPSVVSLTDDQIANADCWWGLLTVGHTTQVTVVQS